MKIKKKLSALMESVMVYLINHYPNNWLIRNFPKGKYFLLDIAKHENKRGWNIIDVGANVGQSVEAFNKWLKEPTVYSFEPVKSTYDQLLANCAKYSNVTCFQHALGNEETTVQIILSHQNQNNSLKESVYSSNQGINYENIKVRKLDNVVAEIKVEMFDILKIDTEGFEIEVLKGAKDLLGKKRIKYVYCEVGFNDEADKVNFEEINKLLRSHDYRLVGIYDVNRIGNDLMYIYFGNALYMLK